MALKVNRTGGNLIRGAFSLLSLTFVEKRDQRRVAAMGENIADSLEDGITVDVDAKDDRVGVAVRRHRKGLKGGRTK